MLPAPTQDPGLRTQDHDAIPASPAHLLTCSPAQASLPFSSRDRELLRLLRDADAIATIDPAEYAAWIERPEIQRAIAAQDDLQERHERLRDAAHRAECQADNRLSRERLRAVLDATMDLTDDAQRADHRRAATALGRLASSGTAARRSSPFIGGGARDRLRRPLPEGVPSPSASTPPRQPAPAAAESRAQPSPPRVPASAVPGIESTVERFLIAAGHEPSWPLAASFLPARRVASFGQDRALKCAMCYAAVYDTCAVRPGPVTCWDESDRAIQQVGLVTRSGGVYDFVVECVLERDAADQPVRWAIWGVGVPREYGLDTS